MMKTVKRISIGIAVMLGTLVLAFAAYVYLPDSVLYASKFRDGKRVVARVESFRQQYHRLPKDLTEVKESDSEGAVVHYQIQGDDHYVVWFGTTLGECITYDSQRRTWEPLCG